MSSRESRSHNDPRANRLPYRPEPRQGRFGRVENWREAEERKAEQIRRQRQAHSRGNAQAQETSRAKQAARTAPRHAQVQAQSNAVQTASQARRGAQQAAMQQKPEAKQRAEQAPAKASIPTEAARPQRARKKAVEPNPWQQGRFGRVENWREEEAKRARRQEAIAAAQAARAEEQASKEQRPQEQAQARKSTRSQVQSSVQAQQSTTQVRSAAAKKPAQPSAQKPAQQQAQPRQAASTQQRNQGTRQGLHSRPQRLGAHSKPTMPKDVSGDIRQYARGTYVSRLQDSDVESPSVHEESSGKFDRRPAVDYPADRRKSLTGKLPRIPMKLVGAIAAVIVIAVVVGFVAFGNDEEVVTPTAGANAPAVATQTPSLPTPIMSQSSGITMHSAVAMEDLTEILIHNASYAYANEITTQLTEATNVDVIDAHGTGRDATTQPTGDNWMTGEFIRCFRSGNAGPVMSAIDCGGPVGATVYAPVTGEVVMVKEYLLYNQIDDFRVHIRPTNRPDLDVVLIHLTDVTVKQGDKVTAGVTPIAKIRDIYQYLDESLQLRQYTAENDNGNHTHIQVNNANHPEYTALDELKAEGAQAAAGNASVQ